MPRTVARVNNPEERVDVRRGVGRRRRRLDAAADDRAGRGGGHVGDLVRIFTFQQGQRDGRDDPARRLPAGRARGRRRCRPPDTALVGIIRGRPIAPSLDDTLEAPTSCCSSPCRRARTSFRSFSSRAASALTGSSRPAARAASVGSRRTTRQVSHTTTAKRGTPGGRDETERGDRRSPESRPRRRGAARNGDPDPGRLLVDPHRVGAAPRQVLTAGGATGRRPAARHRRGDRGHRGEADVC